MSWLIVWAALSVGFVLGFMLAALFRANGPDAPSVTLTALSPAQAARMGDALYHAGEPTYFIDGEEVDYKDLPKGLDAIADKLYEAGPGEYSYSQSDVDNEPDYEPDYDYY